MSVIRLPYTKRDYKGALDSGLVYYILKKYGRSCDLWLDQFPGGNVIRDVARDCDIYLEAVDFVGGEDARDLSKHHDGYFDGVIAHPPYYRGIHYSDDPRDLCNCDSYGGFLLEVVKAFNQVPRVLRSGGWFVAITGDFRKDGVFYETHSDVKAMLQHPVLLDPAAATLLPFNDMVLRDDIHWELSASNTPMKATKHLMQVTHCLVWQKKEVKK